MIFNKWIRNRDKYRPCISGGGHSEQAGHFYAAGSYSGVRFDELNVNGQSKLDNCFRDGNHEDYRAGLIARYSETEVLELDTRARATKHYKWSRAELAQIIERYKL